MIAAAVCPHPPLLVPAMDVGAVAELQTVRAASLEAVRAVLATNPRRVVVIGDGPTGPDRDASAGGTLRGHGVDVRAGGPDLVLPLSLTVGAWLLDACGWNGPRTYATGDVVPGPDDVVLAMADGSARRSIAAPGHLDERAADFDAAIAAALGSGDGAALAGLDVELGDALLAAGTRTLVRLGDLTKGAVAEARLLADEAPLGVGWFAAHWTVG